MYDLKLFSDPPLDSIRFGLLAAAMALLVVLPGCAYVAKLVDPAREYAGKGAAAAIAAECSLSEAQRLENLNSVNVALERDGSSHRALALDCDDDGQPDILKVE